jgi:predicted porin
LLKVGFIESQYDFVGATHKGKLRQFTVGGEYYLSKRTTLYGTAASLSADAMYSPGILSSAPGRDNSSAAMAVGMRHTF